MQVDSLTMNFASHKVSGCKLRGTNYGGFRYN